MESQPARGLRRDEDLEEVVDELERNVTDEREDQQVPGSAKERDETPLQGSADEPPD